MKKLFWVIILLHIFLVINSCNQNKIIPKSELCNIIKDTLKINNDDVFLGRYSIENFNELIDLDKILVDVNYTADSLQRYNFKINKYEFNITIDSCVYKKNKFVSTFFINKKYIKKEIIFVNDSIHYGFDNLNIDYKRSIFYLNKKNNLILIENFSERLVGYATNWQHYQIVNLKKKCNV